MSKNYTAIDRDLQDLFGSTANIKIDKTKRKRLFNKVLADLMLYSNWLFAIRRVRFNYLKSVGEYHVENDIGIEDYGSLKKLGGVPIVNEEDFYPQRIGSLQISDKLFKNREAGSYQRVAETMLEGDPYLLVNLAYGQTLQISSLDSLTGEGTWLAVGDSISLAVDTQEYKQGSASLKFDIDVSNSIEDYAGIKNTTLNSIDLTDYGFASDFLIRVYLPDATGVESIELRIGSSETAYYLMTATVPITGSSFRDGWNRIKLAFDSATKPEDAPDITALTYVEIRINYADSYTDHSAARLDDLQINQRIQLDLDYFSTYLVKSTAGVRRAEIIEDSDFLITENDVVNVLVELTYYQMLRSTKSLRKIDRDEAFINYRTLRRNLKHKYGYAVKRGSKHLKIRR